MARSISESGNTTCLTVKASFSFLLEVSSMAIFKRTNSMALHFLNLPTETSTKAFGGMENSKAIVTSISVTKIDGYFLTTKTVNSSALSRKEKVYPHHVIIHKKGVFLKVPLIYFKMDRCFQLHYVNI